MQATINQKALNAVVDSLSVEKMIPIFVGKRKIHKKHKISSGTVQIPTINGYEIDGNSIQLNLSYFALLASGSDTGFWSYATPGDTDLIVLSGMTLDASYNVEDIDYNKLYIVITDASDVMIHMSKIQNATSSFTLLKLQIGLQAGVSLSGCKAYILSKESQSLIDSDPSNLVNLSLNHPLPSIPDFNPVIYNESSVENDYIQSSYSFDIYRSYEDISGAEANKSLLTASQLCKNGFIVASVPSDLYISDFIDELQMSSTVNGYYIAPISDDLDLSQVRSFIDNLPINNWYILIEPSYDCSQSKELLTGNYSEEPAVEPAVERPSYALDVEMNSPLGAFIQIRM